jgi:DNA topoisomerase-1
MASFGHLRTIEGLENIDIENGFTTTYSIINETIKLKQIEKIRTEIANSSAVVLATDDDREGEAIAWHICDLFGLSVANTQRILFHEITETAIQSAIAHPKKINMNLVNAQQSRQILDLLVGYTISPILWNCIAKNLQASLSAGRCQTPALRIVYENYLDIKATPGTLVYQTTGYFTNLNLLFDLNKQFSNKSEVIMFLEACKSFSFLCSTTPPKKVIKKQPEPLTTSNLQQLASNELHFSPKDTMRYAQQLYENGYITYMRTDSKKYSKEFVEKVKTHIQNSYGEKYISGSIDYLVIGYNTNTLNNNIVNDSDNLLEKKKKSKSVAEKKGVPPPQEAHEAIRPVYIEKTFNKEKEQQINDLEPKAIRLYELIWKRTLESCMPAAQYNSITAKITAPLETEFVYKTEQPIFKGWQIVQEINTKKPTENKDISVYQYISNLKQNIEMKPKKIESKFTYTDLKSHYTEARLVQLLEDKGIGRPSTFASLVDKIQERKYVLKQDINGKEVEATDYTLNNNIVEETTNKKIFGNEKNKLVIQPLGILVIEFLLSKFDTFFNYDYTKEMEDELDRIAKGQQEWSSLCKKCNDNLNHITKDLQDIKKFSLAIDNDHILLIGKYGPVVKYTDPKNKKNVTFIPVKKDIDLEELKHSPELKLEDIIDPNAINKNAIGKYKGQDLFVKKGKYGVYAQWGKETKSLTGFSENPEYIDVIRFLDKDNALDPSKPVGLIRELTEYMSIRSSKHGDYIFYKKPRAKKPEFLKLKDFNGDYKQCDKLLLLNWIKQTYNI